MHREILDTPSRSALRRNDYFRLVDGFILHLVETESFEEAFIFLTEAKMNMVPCVTQSVIIALYVHDAIARTKSPMHCPSHCPSHCQAEDK